MSAKINEEIVFEKGEKVYFRNPQSGGRYQAHLEKLISDAGKRGPFFAVSVRPCPNPGVHSQTVIIGDSVEEPLMITYGSDDPEPLELSGSWLAKE